MILVMTNDELGKIVIMLTLILRGLQPKNTENEKQKEPKKPVPNLKFAVAFGLSVFSVYPVFLEFFRVFVRSELQQKIKANGNHVKPLIKNHLTITL